jgi:hypothetical protein
MKFGSSVALCTVKYTASAAENGVFQACGLQALRIDT